jgi:uncharacterized protein YllA (UPF0747 family)
MPALFLDYVEDWSRVERFYRENYSLDSIVAFAQRRPRLAAGHLERLCRGLYGDSGGIQKLAGGAVAVLTGQQPGLFSGPNYTILKAISVLKIARELENRGVAAVPVFWAAAEDHDSQEISSTFILDRDSALREIRVDLANETSSPVGFLKLKGDVTTAVSECLSALPQSEFLPEIRVLLESSYRPGSSPVEAFIKMLSQVFSGTGLVFADPLHPELKRLAAPVLEQAVRMNPEIRSAVLARSRDLSEAGYHEQVKVDANFTGLFAYRGRSRQVLRPHELATDSMLSPNVLLRPVVQDSLFPTAVYVGGPAEIAYWAQAAAIYPILNVPMPPVFPRISATVLEARVGRPLKKYGMEFSDVIRGRDFMKRKAVESVQGVDLFDRLRDRFAEELDLLRPALNAVDPTLVGALDNSRQKILHQVEGLRTRYVNAEARRNEILEKHLDAIAHSLFPEKKLQERVINIVSFLVRYGSGFAGLFENALDADPGEHQVVEI